MARMPACWLGIVSDASLIRVGVLLLCDDIFINIIIIIVGEEGMV